MIHLPHSMKVEFARTIKPILEKWSNQTLEFSTMYGIREYYRGSRLENHLDKVATHVVSAIINVCFFHISV